MKRMKTVLLLALLLVSQTLTAAFDDYFTARTLRIDYFHSGDKLNEYYSFDEMKIEPYWGGSKVNLVDTFNYGEYCFRAFDALSGTLLYSRGYSSLFGEWQTTDEATVTTRSFSETVVMPLPIAECRIVFYSRNRKGVSEERFSCVYKPGNYFISDERRMEFPALDILISGPPEKKIDIVLLPEGYTAGELKNFENDCQKFTDNLFAFSPYKEYKDRFSIRAVLAPSDESGSDIPAENTWKKTVLNSSFYTFDSERYCMIYDNKTVRDVAANAPYDQVYVLVNTTKYGGGAIYNHYSVSVNGNLFAARIFIHEFGHGFAGLGDEYYTSSTSYNDFYPLDVEPWEPNLTTLVDFDKKWKKILDPAVPVPTPDEQKYYEQPGVFEGGGYVAKGIYRPAYDCLMNSFNSDKFCRVCEEAIIRMIKFYSE